MFIITQSNSSAKQIGSLRIRTMDGITRALIRSPRSKILQYAKNNPFSQERLDIVAQMEQAGYSKDEIDTHVIAKG